LAGGWKKQKSFKAGNLNRFFLGCAKDFKEESFWVKSLFIRKHTHSFSGRLKGGSKIGKPMK